MRIGLLIYGSLDIISGGYLYDRKLVGYLRQQGVEVDIISLPWRGYGRSILHNFSPSLFRQLKDAPYDLLLQDELNHPSLFLLNRWLKSHINYPIISIVHHLRSQERWPAWQLPLYRAIERRYLNSVDGFIFNSKTTRDTVLLDPKGFGKPLGSDHYVIAYPAGDRFQPTITPSEIIDRATKRPFRLLFVGNLIPRKGLHNLIAALAQLEGEDWQLNVVGETAVSPTYTHQIQQHIKAANLSHKIKLHGTATDPQLKNLYQQSHLLVVPSQYEGFGIVYLEGMGFGLPAIGSIHGAAHEIITHGVDGFLVDGEKTACPRVQLETVGGVGPVFTQHLQSLIQDRHQLTQMSLAAQNRYAIHPTWNISMEKIAAFLQTTIDN